MIFKRSIFVVKWVEAHPEYKFTAKVEVYRNRDIAMSRVAELVDLTKVDNDTEQPKILSAVELSEILI
jgi:hypothetical protein